MTSPKRLAVLLAPLLLAPSACYRYANATPESLIPGSDVRARITEDETNRLAAQVPGTGRVVVGKFVSADGSQLMLQIPSAPIQPVPGAPVLYQRVQVPRSEIQRLQSRRLDVARTVGLGVGFAAALTAIIATQFHSESSQQPNPQPGPGEIVVPVAIPLGPVVLRLR